MGAKSLMFVVSIVIAWGLPTILAISPISSASPDQALYGCTSNSNGASSLYSIDPLTGTASLIGTMGITGCTGLAFGYNMTLFASGTDADSNVQIFQVDTSTGVATTVIPLSPVKPRNNGAFSDITFRNGVFFASGSLGTELWRIDPQDGWWAQSGQMTGCCGNGLDFALNGSLIHAHQSSLAGQVFESVNTTTGALISEAVVDMSGLCGVGVVSGTSNAIDYAENGTLYVSVRCNGIVPSNILVTVDLNTVTATLIGSTVNTLDGIAFLPSTTLVQVICPPPAPVGYQCAPQAAPSNLLSILPGIIVLLFGIAIIVILFSLVERSRR